MRKLISILLVIILVFGAAMAVAEYLETGKLPFKSTSTQNVVTSQPVTTPAPTSVSSTLAPVTATPAPVVQKEAMSFYDWLRLAQNTESGALWGTFDEENAERITFIEGEEITGYANLMVAGKYFSTQIEGRNLSSSQKANRGIEFHACDQHEGHFFDWHSKATGTFVRYELTSELVEELKEVAVSWTDEDGNTVYGVLCCQHKKASSSSSSSSKKPSSNGGGGTHQTTPPPTVTREPLKIENPPVDPTPRPADNQQELENQGPREEIDHDNGHSSSTSSKPADNQQELENQGAREKVDHDNGHSNDPAPKQENSSGHSNDPAPKQESSSGHSKDPAPKQESSSGSSNGGHSADPESEEREDLNISMDW